mgnify:CR=1 FL=1
MDKQYILNADDIAHAVGKMVQGMEGASVSVAVEFGIEPLKQLNSGDPKWRLSAVANITQTSIATDEVATEEISPEEIATEDIPAVEEPAAGEVV